MAVENINQPPNGSKMRQGCHCQTGPTIKRNQRTCEYKEPIGLDEAFAQNVFNELIQPEERPVDKYGTELATEVIATFNLLLCHDQP